jgi:CMP-N-acetylneuraminic acid synthetase
VSAVAIIPARGGSQRLPRKNIRPFYGVTMLERAITEAKDSGLFRDVYVSSEDDEILSVAMRADAKTVWRPENLARNDVGTQAVVRNAIQTLHLKSTDTVCCIYPCTPLMTADDLRMAHRRLPSASYVIAVNGDHGGDIGWFYFGLARRFLSGAPLWNTKTRIYPIESERAIDINTADDFERAVQVYQKWRRAA